MIAEKEVILNVDFYDLPYFAYRRGEGSFDEARIKRMIDRSADEGVDTIFWRVTAHGTVTYHSKMATVFTGDPRRPSRAVAEALKNFDPLRVGIEHTRRRGLRVYAWMSLYNECSWMGMESEFGRQHPEYYWVSRDGNHYLRGILCYAYPEVREYKLSIVRELAEYDLDGLYFSLRNYGATPTPFHKQENMFGFNRPIVEEYKRRYGVDITEFDDVECLTDRDGHIEGIIYKGGALDVERWHRLKGEYLTLFLEEAKEVLREKDLKLILDIRRWDSFTNRTIEGINAPAQLHLNWPKWVQDGTIDGLVVIPRPPIEAQKQLLSEETIETEFSPYRRQMGECRLYAFQSLLYYQMGLAEAAAFVKGMRRKPVDGYSFIGPIVERVAANDPNGLLDGIVLHEAAAFEFPMYEED